MQDKNMINPTIETVHLKAFCKQSNRDLNSVAQLTLKVPAVQSATLL